MFDLLSIQYLFDLSTGKAKEIDCSFSIDTTRNEYIGGPINLYNEDLTDGRTLDDLNRSEIEQLAKQRLLTLIQKGVEGK